MTVTTAPRITGALIAGGLLIFFGVLFTLDNFGVLDAGDVLDYWPLILVAIGLVKVLQPRNEGQRTFGYVLLAFGFFFLFQIFLFHHIRVAWPFILLAVGALLVWHALRKDKAPGVDPALPPGSPQSDFALMGGVHRVVETTDFRGGEATAIMGAVELDLRGASIATSPAVLDVFALWGGIELTVPSEWRVEVQGTPILGGFENKARSSPPASGAPAPVLVVRGTAIMGGVEIKN
jgi:predicted membrane protein